MEMVGVGRARVYTDSDVESVGSSTAAARPEALRVTLPAVRETPQLRGRRAFICLGGLLVITGLVGIGLLEDSTAYNYVGRSPNASDGEAVATPFDFDTRDGDTWCLYKPQWRRGDAPVSAGYRVTEQQWCWPNSISHLHLANLDLGEPALRCAYIVAMLIVLLGIMTWLVTSCIYPLPEGYTRSRSAVLGAVSVSLVLYCLFFAFLFLLETSYVFSYTSANVADINRPGNHPLFVKDYPSSHVWCKYSSSGTESAYTVLSAVLPDEDCPASLGYNFALDASIVREMWVCIFIGCAIALLSAIATPLWFLRHLVDEEVRGIVFLWCAIPCAVLPIVWTCIEFV